MSLVYAQMGMSIAETAFSFGTQKVEADIASMRQKYQNAMAAISAAQELNTVTANEINTRDAIQRAGEALQVQSMKDMASTEADAAASGVRGGSVTSAMRGLVRSRMQAKSALHQRMKQQAHAFTQQRRNVAVAKAYGQDRSVISQPSTASALLGLGASLIDIYDSNQAPGTQIKDEMAGWGRSY